MVARLLAPSAQGAMSASPCIRGQVSECCMRNDPCTIPSFSWGSSPTSVPSVRHNRRLAERTVVPGRFVPAALPPRRLVLAMAKKKKVEMDPNYPWPEKMDTSENSFLSFLSKFKPEPERKAINLPFEKQVVEMQRTLEEVRITAKKTGMDFTQQIAQLEASIDQLRRDIYSRLTPVQRLGVARHPNRPTFLDHVLNITDKWVELHGDRGGYDDPALVTGIGKIDDMSFMFMGHQKGRSTKENIFRNFGMPTPNGYRKALRMMRHAEHHGFPILTFIDTPGAYAGITAEELGQGEAIAHNLRDMFGIKVPIITTVIGEGGSGGALAIGCCDRMLMLENSVYYVASPEACAAILWKTATAAPLATVALRITGHELQKLKVVDEVIREPVGGAHGDPLATSLTLKDVIMRHMRELLSYSWPELQSRRLAKFRDIGQVDDEGAKGNEHIKRNMKKREAPPEPPLPAPLRLPDVVLQDVKETENGKHPQFSAQADGMAVQDVLVR